MPSSRSLLSARENPAPDPSYVWTFPGAPVRVLLPLSVVSRLEHACLDARNPVASQIHGFLLGWTPKMSDGQYVVRISDYWLLPPPNPQQPVDAQQVEKFRAELAGDSWPDGGVLDVLGYWRTENSADAKRLHAEEASWANACFPKPYHLILSIQNRQGRSPSASFLVRDKDGFVPFSLLEFPLNADKLRLSSGGEQLEVPGPKLAPVRQEPDLPGVSPPASWTARLNGKGRSTLYVGLGAAFLLGAGALLLRDRFPSSTRLTASDKVSSAASPADQQQFPTTPLALKVETAGEGLQVQWRLPASASPDNLVGGRLVITESGRKPRTVELSSEQLRQGRLFYQPAADQVQFLLEVLLLKNGLLQDSILAFGPRSARATRTEDERTIPPTLKPSTTPPAPVGKESNVPPSASPGLSARVVPPSPAPRIVSADPEPPQLSERPPSLPQSLPTSHESVNRWTQSSLPSAPRPAAPVVEDRVPAQPVAEPAKATRSSALDTYRPPVPIEEKRPLLEKGLWSRVMRDVPVEVRVHVDKYGRVVRAEAVQKGTVGVTQALTAVAQQTVSRWRFKPATLAGQPVEADHTVRFVFHPMNR